MSSVLCTSSASVPPVCHPLEQSRQAVLQGCQDHILRGQNIWAGAAMCLSDWGEEIKKKTLLLKGWFQKRSRQEQHPSCSAHKDLTEWLGSQREWNISLIFFTAEKTWKITGVHLLLYFCSKVLPYLKREEEDIKLAVPTSLTSPTPLSFPPISWTWLRFLTAKPRVQHRGWEHTEGQWSVCL